MMSTRLFTAMSSANRRGAAARFPIKIRLFPRPRARIAKSMRAAEISRTRASPQSSAADLLPHEQIAEEEDGRPADEPAVKRRARVGPEDELSRLSEVVDPLEEHRAPVAEEDGGRPRDEHEVL